MTYNGLTIVNQENPGALSDIRRACNGLNYREGNLHLRIHGFRAAAMFLLATGLFGAEELLVIPAISGHPGGILVYAQRTEPKTLNPVTSSDNASREVLHRTTGDLIHINRETQQTEPALAKSWTVSPDGLRYTLDLRRGVRFSDGHPFDADDVVFSFQV